MSLHQCMGKEGDRGVDGKEREKRRNRRGKRRGREPCKKNSKDVVRIIILKHGIRNTNAPPIVAIVYEYCTFQHKIFEIHTHTDMHT